MYGDLSFERQNVSRHEIELDCISFVKERLARYFTKSLRFARAKGLIANRRRCPRSTAGFYA